MRTIPIVIQAELDSGSPRIARLVKLICKDTTTFGFTDHEVQLTVGGQLYKPAPALFSVKYVATSSTEVSSQNMSAGWVDLPENDLRGGKIDNAKIIASWCSWANPGGGEFVVFSGNIGEITYDESGFNVDIVSFMKALERNIGHSYTSTCRHKLFSQPGPGTLGGCMLSPSAFTFAGAITEVNIPKWKFGFSGAALGKGDGYFSAGQITFTSGFNTGLSSIVKMHATERFELFLPAAFILPVGTTFTVQAGCDKTMTTCKAKFNNVLNHGGFPNINPNVQYR